LAESEQQQGDPDDKRLLVVLSELGWADADLIDASVAESRIDGVRVRRWLASAQRRGLLEVQVESDQLGRVVGPREFRLSPAGARLLNSLASGRAE
jgi:hypothetical protein